MKQAVKNPVRRLKREPRNKPAGYTLLESYKRLNEGIKQLNEDELWDLLRYERKTRNRLQVCLRIHQRANRLRALREIKAITWTRVK